MISGGGRATGVAENQTNPPPRPEWAPAKPKTQRMGLSSFGKRVICNARDSMAAILNKEDSPLLRNAHWLRENPSGPMRKIVSQLCGVGNATVSNCISGGSKSGGVLRYSAPFGGKKKGPIGVKMKKRRAGERVAPRRLAAARRRIAQVRNGEHMQQSPQLRH